MSAGLVALQDRSRGIGQMLKPDVIVADISMPGTDGLTAMKEILKRLPHVRMILRPIMGMPRWCATHLTLARLDSF